MKLFINWLKDAFEECNKCVAEKKFNTHETSQSGCCGNPLILAGMAMQRFVSIHPFYYYFTYLFYTSETSLQSGYMYTLSIKFCMT